MPSLVIQPTTLPVDAALSQSMLNTIAASLQVSGLENLQGVVVSLDTPTAVDRDKVWLKLDGSGRALSLYVYRGDWTQLPLIAPNGEAEPASPKKGELFFNTAISALKLFNGTVWTTNFFHTGTTSQRPTSVPEDYLFLDTEIDCLLRHTNNDWTTFDGRVGDVKIVSGISIGDAETRNPGWSVFTEMDGRFPIGASDTVPYDQNGGTTLADLKLTVATEGHSAQRGNQEQPFVSTITVNGVPGASGASSGSKTSASTSVDLKPPYRAVIFLRKNF